MGFFSSSPHWSENPFVGPGISGLEGFANNVSLGQAGRSAKGIIKQMKSGDYTNLAGTLLSPIHDSYATNLREAMRGNSMGANAFMQGWQPGLMAATEQATRAKMAQDEGLAYGQAIPQLYGQATSTYQNAYNAMNQNELAAREAALRGRIAGSQMYQTPSTWQNIVGFGQGLGQLAGLI